MSLAEELQGLLEQIAALYQDDVVMSLVVRSLNSPDGSRDTCVTNDPDLTEALATLKRLWRDPESRVEAAVKLELAQ